MKNLLLVGSVASTTAATVLDPNSVNLLVNAVLTIVMFVLRFIPKKKGGNDGLS